MDKCLRSGGCRLLLASRPALLASVSPPLSPINQVWLRPPVAGRQLRRYAALSRPRRENRDAPRDPAVWSLDEFTVSHFQIVYDHLDTNSKERVTSPPDVCYEAAQKFSMAVRSHNDDPWKFVLSASELPHVPVKLVLLLNILPGHGIPADQLYAAAEILYRLDTSRKKLDIGLAMNVSASAMGHLWATLSLVRGSITRGVYGKSWLTAGAERQFQRLITEGKNPTVFTLEGIRLYREEKFEAAIRVLQRALGLGKSGFPDQNECQFYLAKSRLKLRKHDEQASLMLQSLSDSGYAFANVEIADMIKESDPARAEKLLYEAATKGLHSSYVGLSEMAMEKASNAKDDATRLEHRRWATEWTRLSDLKNVY